MRPSVSFPLPLRTIEFRIDVLYTTELQRYVHIFFSFLSPSLWLQTLDKCEYSLQKLRVSTEYSSPCTIYERLKMMIQNFSISYETQPLQLGFWKYNYSRYKRWINGVLCHHCMHASCWYSIHQNGLQIHKVSQNRIITKKHSWSDDKKWSSTSANTSRVWYITS